MLPYEVQDNTPVDVTSGFTRGDAKIIEINFAQAVKGICCCLELYHFNKPCLVDFSFFAENLNEVIANSHW